MSRRRWAAAVLRAVGAVNLAGKLDESQMERLQREFPGARFVKAFKLLT